MKVKLTDQDPARHNNIAYPMDIGDQFFAPINIEKEKDLMLSLARMNATQEYERIMESVRVLKKQADELMRRVKLTNLIHSAKFGFKPVPGKNYWLFRHTGTKFTTPHIGLGSMGPDDWSSPPDEYEFIAQVKCLGDQTWQEVKNDAG